MDTQSTCNRGDHQISHLDRTLLIVRIYSHILDSTLDTLMFASWVLSQLIMLYQQGSVCVGSWSSWSNILWWYIELSFDTRFRLDSVSVILSVAIDG